MSGARWLEIGCGLWLIGFGATWALFHGRSKLPGGRGPDGER